MKLYKGVKLYSKLTPEIWYRNDNPFSENFHESEPYEFKHIFESKLSVTYHIDKFGFRNYNEMNSNLWFFGCSHMFCEALEYEKSFPHLIAKELNIPFYNFGTLGASIDLIARLLFKLKNKLKDKTTIIFFPHYSRYETLIANKFYNMVSNQETYIENLPTKNVEDSLNYRLIKNIMLIKNITENNKVHFFSKNNNELLQKNLQINLIPKSLLVDHAYDNMHFGEITNKNIANFILNSIK